MESIKSDPQFQNLIRPQNCPILPTALAHDPYPRSRYWPLCVAYKRT